MSTKSKVIDAVYDTIRSIIDNRHDISMTSDLIDDLNGDSLDIVEITMSVEEYFGIEIPDNKIETMRTVGDIVFYVDSII